MREHKMPTRSYAGDIETTAQYMVKKVKNVNLSWEDLHNIHPDYIKYILEKGFDMHERFYAYVMKFSEVCGDSSMVITNIIEELKIAKAGGNISDAVGLEIRETSKKLGQFHSYFESEGYIFLDSINTCEKDLKIVKAKEREQLPMDRLSLFMRTADDWVERLYAEAKKTGVNLSDKPVPNDVLLKELSHGMSCLQDGFKSFSNLLDIAAFDLITSLEFFIEVQQRPRTTLDGQVADFGQYVQLQAESMIKIAQAIQKGFKDFNAEMSKNKKLACKFFDK
ncbi:uncharacterized protein EV154DRAFT_580936 [Mucor mucedo]|uniref:uncharacterized protein n=1 Tax=Mucor mucedo TaxID=29922 RepID=UPI00221F084C|nr:uncharacterized protein EV154DRAFT_580936 [Mucor mucedo]KAI7894025.1 hypothetical protein EV154DRAFT_580936 [Mucor mucedo]